MSLLEPRYYDSPDGKKYVSVTTALDQIKEIWIESWRSKVGLEEAHRVMTNAGKWGTDFHDLTLLLDMGIGFEPPPDMKLQADRYLQWKRDNLDGDWISSEKQILNHQWEYGGRIDRLGLRKGFRLPTLFDFKTGNVNRKHFIQMALYREGLILAGIEVDPIMAILRFPPGMTNRTMIMKEIPYDPRHLRAGLWAVGLYYYFKDGKEEE